MGFSDLDVDFMFDGDDRFTEMFETEEAEATKEQIAEIHEARGAMKGKLDERTSLQWYTTLVFKDEQEMREFYKKINTPFSERYLSAEVLKRLNR